MIETMRGPNIVLIEDQAAVREVLAEVSSELSSRCRIHCASSLAEARALLRRVSCDCMVTDLQLGDGESLDLLRELQADGKHFPVILISGFLTPEYLREAKALGVTHTLSKPFRPGELLEKLRDCTAIAADPEEKPPTRQKSKAAVVPFPRASAGQRILPELFELDRQLTLLDRLLTVHSSEANVAEICFSAARIAIDITRSTYGFVALLEGGERLLLAGHASQETDNPFHAAENACAIEDTPFGDLFGHKGQQESLVSGYARICWPDLMARQFFALPITLQDKPVGVLCVVDPQSEELTPIETRMLGHLIREMDTMLDNRASHAALSGSVKESLIAMAKILEARDRYTKDHSARVSSMAVQLARNLGLDDNTIQLVRTGGLLHDIGKVGVPDSILLKPDSYNEQEYTAMKAHPGMGDQLLKPIDMLVEERRIVRHHHERWDGKGYPDGLAGEEIPLPARIVGIADAIDAMTTHRVYRQAQPLSFCLEQLHAASGSQFDPTIVKAAIAAIEAGQIRTLAADETPRQPLRPRAAG